MKCKGCNSKLDDGSEFCQNCGITVKDYLIDLKVTVPIIFDHNKDMQCPFCNETIFSIKKDKIVCLECEKEIPVRLIPA